MAECIQHMEILDMNETSGQDPLVDMLIKIQKVQMNKNLSDLRLKDSKEHVEEMEKMLHLLEEVQITKMYGDQRLQRAEEEALILNRKIRSLEKMLQENQTEFSPEEHCRHNRNEKTNDETERLHPSVQNKGSKEEQITNKLHRHLYNPECMEDVNKEESVLTLMDCTDQEMAVLSDKLSSSTSSSVSLIKLELLKKIVEKQLLHDAQVIELKKTLSSLDKKFNFLEEHHTCVQTKLLNGQEEKAKLIGQTHTHLPEDILKQRKDWVQGELNSSFHCHSCQMWCEHQQCGHPQDNVLQEQLAVAMEQLHRAEEEKTCFHALLEQRTQERTQELWGKKKVELKLKQPESEQHMASKIEATHQCQKLHTDIEALKMLQDNERTNETLRGQLKHKIQQTEEYSCISQNLHKEIHHLGDQLNHLKMDILHLRAEVDHYKLDLAAVERDKRKLQASEAKHSRRVQEEILAKHQLSIKLEKQDMQLRSLTEEHKELQLLYSCMNKEKEGVVLQLQSHLKNVQTELDQAKSALRTLEQKDNHGLQVAQSMQKEITAGRRQIYSLQSKTKEKLCQEESPSSDNGSLLFKDKYGVKKHRPHTATAANRVCRRSAPKRVQSNSLSTDKTEVLGGIQLRNKNSSESHHLKTPKLKEKVHYNLFSYEPLMSTPPASMSSPQLLGRRSPVHTLLTSDPQ
ncbi:uncharacterized protein [Eucyclogobius newberryi]|uniref:uncharacterized protein n=1 Tax=Eucyclogobius newberryi TaxID=166745 RepID=UPI003B58FFEE